MIKTFKDIYVEIIGNTIKIGKTGYVYKYEYKYISNIFLKNGIKVNIGKNSNVYKNKKYTYPTINLFQNRYNATQLTDFIQDLVIQHTTK